MLSEMKRKRPASDGAAATDGDGVAARAPELDRSKNATRAVDGEESPPRRGSMDADVDRHLALLRSCAEVLLTSDVAAAQEVFLKLAPALDLDAFAAFLPTGVDHALTLEAASGVTDTAISSSGIAATSHTTASGYDERVVQSRHACVGITCTQ